MNHEIQEQIYIYIFLPGLYLTCIHMNVVISTHVVSLAVRTSGGNLGETLQAWPVTRVQNPAWR
jgi:hypothetical protein